MEYTIVRSKRKTVAITVKDGKVVVFAPLKFPQKAIDGFVKSKEKWILKKLSTPKITLKTENKEALKLTAKSVLTEKTRLFSEITGLYPTKIKVTSAKTRWGSCSYKNGICYTFWLVLLPEHLIDYVVVHELCHIKYKNHQKEFYDLLKRYIPNYKSLRSELKQYSIGGQNETD